MIAMNVDDTPEVHLLARAAGGDEDAWGALLMRHRIRLQCAIAFRMDPRLRGRVDSADVMQEAFIAATARRAEFFRQPTQSLFLWLRWMVGNKLLELHRSHLGAQVRDLRREVSVHRGSDGENGDSTRAALVAYLTAGATGPATAAGRSEVQARLNQALEMLDAIDREVPGRGRHDDAAKLHEEALALRKAKLGAITPKRSRASKHLRKPTRACTDSPTCSSFAKKR